MLGEMGKYSKSLGDDRVLTQTLQSCRKRRMRTRALAPDLRYSAFDVSNTSIDRSTTPTGEYFQSHQ